MEVDQIDLGGDAAHDFPDGSITKIVFHDFLTYEHMEIFPGPNLNLIVGANGTGKSTIICGICLALGGSPKLLGRSEHLSDYIRFGADHGSVEVCVRDSKRENDRTFSINVHTGGATFNLDGCRSTQKEIRHIAAQYNIQVDNPCTFLAQDKVRSFAEQDPHILLCNTQKALEPELVRLFEAFKDLQKETRYNSENLHGLENRLLEMENELRALALVVDNYRRREIMRERIRFLERKRLYIGCWAAMKVAEERNQHWQEKQNEFRKVKQSMIPIERNKKHQEDLMAQQKKYVRNAKYELKSLHGEVEKLLGMESVGDRLICAKRDYERVKKDYDDWEAHLIEVRIECNHLQSTLSAANENLESFERENSVIKKDYLMWNAEEEKLDRMKSEVDKIIAEIDIERRALNEIIESKQEIFRKKLLIMDGIGQEMQCADAWQWYESHKEQFKHPVYVPLLHMTLTGSDADKYLENIIASRDLLMFIFRCEEDESVLTDERHPWKINSSVMTDEEIANFCQHETMSAVLRSMGFSYFASDLYTAPDPVKAYLNSVAMVYKIPIGNQETEDRLDEICEELKNSYRIFLTNATRVQITVSRYGGSLSIRTDSLETSLRFLVAHTASQENSEYSSEALEKKLAELTVRDNEVQVTRLRIVELERNITQGREECRKKMDMINRKMCARNAAVVQLRSKTALLRAMEVDKPDLGEAAKTRENTKKKVIAEALERSERIAAYMERSNEFVRNEYFALLEVNAAREKTEFLNERMECFKAEYERISDEVQHEQEAVDRARAKVEECKKLFHDMTGISDVVEEELSKEEKTALQNMKTKFDADEVSNDLEVLEIEIAREKGKLKAVHSEGELKDIERFEKLTQDKEGIEKDAAIARKYINERENRLNRAAENWLVPLENAVERISHHYSSFLENLGCAGKVHLQKPDNKNEVLGYGIVITASFRKGERLRKLSHKIQSGGERSVSTILYVLALQELTKVPFRCVDEINQGMDSTNEKRVFDMIAAMLSSDAGLAKTQYFLLTPKLVPGLIYNRKTKIHCIIGSEKLARYNKWDVGGFLTILCNEQAAVGQ